MTVVPAARAAAAYGVRDAGVTTMHDAIDGGVYEVAEASGVGLRINQSAIPIRPEVAAVCAAAGIDPYFSISEGTLVATVRPQHAQGPLAALAKANISAADVGEVLPAGAARTMLDAHGREVPLTPRGSTPTGTHSRDGPPNEAPTTPCWAPPPGTRVPPRAQGGCVRKANPSVRVQAPC